MIIAQGSAVGPFNIYLSMIIVKLSQKKKNKHTYFFRLHYFNLN